MFSLCSTERKPETLPYGMSWKLPYYVVSKESDMNGNEMDKVRIIIYPMFNSNKS